MKRRDLIGAGLGAASLGALAGCKQQACESGTTTTGSTQFHWKMVTTWPPNFPALGTGVNFLADLITSLSGGRLTVKVYGAGELVPAFEVFDAVSAGTAEMGHGSAYYWKGKIPEAQFFSSVPFGLTAQEMSGWLYFGGAMELWREVYAPYGLVPFDAGNTTVQMAGWFNKPINSVADLTGLKMRIPGLGGEVLRRLGVTVQNIPGGELFQALNDGTIDATEWVGPYNDLAFGLHKAAKYCYYPGWHEPGTVLECIVNRKAFDRLPEDLQAIVEAACRVASQNMVAEFTARNDRALQTLVDEHGVDLRPLPADVLAAISTVADEVVAEVGRTNAMAERIYASYMTYRKGVSRWTDIAERALLNARES
ncbi:TRAP transporter substrate-binding protein [uncultured Abyssibacter sp.]|uniref:TRAP transporter substrate-binding protein n=1 Tax=uncultured Abyssibacter sp. TaxID=2320202 RepID=UPI0032B141B6